MKTPDIYIVTTIRTDIDHPGRIKRVVFGDATPRRMMDLSKPSRDVIYAYPAIDDGRNK